MKKLLILLMIIGSLVLVSTLVFPFKKAEIWVLYKTYQMGSGMDDGAIDIFAANKARYKDTILKMLDNSQLGNFDSLASFTFGELLMDDPQIQLKVRELSENHPEDYIRCYWHDVINQRFEKVAIIDSNDLTNSDAKNQFIAYRIIDHGSKCK